MVEAIVERKLGEIAAAHQQTLRQVELQRTAIEMMLEAFVKIATYSSYIGSESGAPKRLLTELCEHIDGVFSDTYFRLKEEDMDGVITGLANQYRDSLMYRPTTDPAPTEPPQHTRGRSQRPSDTLRDILGDDF